MYFQISTEKHVWAVVYDKAKRDDGTLFFPQRLDESFLAEQRKVQGAYIFANQYQNEIIPGDAQDFKDSWLKYYEEIPRNVYTFIFLDPAISQQSTADFTAYVVVHVDANGYWYLEQAKRQRINATDTIKLIFDLCDRYKPMAFGLETVAYQKALLHFLDEEMKRRKTVIPVTGINRGPDKTKEQRILSLVPRFEWGRIFLNRSLDDFVDEYAKFPRSRYDDLLDALASIEEIAFPPQTERTTNEPKSPHDRGYESWYINQLGEEAGQTSED
jgi:predicted phage terminase large subunit-like protein